MQRSPISGRGLRAAPGAPAGVVLRCEWRDMLRPDGYTADHFRRHWHGMSALQEVGRMLLREGVGTEPSAADRSEARPEVTGQIGVLRAASVGRTRIQNPGP